MSRSFFLGTTRYHRRVPPPVGTEHVIIRRPLDVILHHLNYSIDDVVNDRIAKHAVLGYFKLSRQVSRQCEIVDLEKQWNPI